MDCPPKNGHDLAKFSFELLGDIAKITSQDIAEVRSAFSDEMKADFDHLPDDQQMILAALHKRDIEEVMMIARSNIYCMGAHNIGGVAEMLIACTSDRLKNWARQK